LKREYDQRSVDVADRFLDLRIKLRYERGDLG